MSNSAIVSAARAAMAAQLATQTVGWLQYPAGIYNPVTGAGGSSVTTTIDVIIYGETNTQNSDGTTQSTLKGVVIPEDLPHAVGKTDCFTNPELWGLVSFSPDPTGSIIEFEARR